MPRSRSIPLGAIRKARDLLEHPDDVGCTGVGAVILSPLPCRRAVSKNSAKRGGRRSVVSPLKQRR